MTLTLMTLILMTLTLMIKMTLTLSTLIPKYSSQIGICEFDEYDISFRKSSSMA